MKENRQEEKRFAGEEFPKNIFTTGRLTFTGNFSVEIKCTYGKFYNSDIIMKFLTFDQHLMRQSEKVQKVLLEARTR